MTSTPVITLAPAGGSINFGVTHTMTITASIRDRGTLSYQWYTYESPIQYEHHLGTRIEGATRASFTTPVFNTEGIRLFYVIVRNTNNNATGIRVSSIQSAPIMVVVNDPINAAFPVISAHPQNMERVIFSLNMDLPVLTVEAGCAASHSKLGWQQFTDAIIEKLSERKEPIAFILWGAYARSKKPLIKEHHLIIESVHPSPLSAHNGFFGSKPFSQANNFINKQKKS